MPFSSGTFSVVYNWTTESGASPIEIAKLDTQHADFATGLSNCILRDGTGLPTAAIPFNSQNITGVAELQAARFVPTGSTVPTNGMYLPAANTVALASNTTLRASVNSAGNWTFAAPSSGTALTVTSASGAYASTLSSGGSALSAGYNIGLLSNAWNLHTTGTDPFVFGTISAATAALYTNSAQRILVGTAGNVTVNAPSSGAALTVTGVAAGTSAQFTDGTRTARIDHSASNVDFGSFTADALNLVSNSSRRVVIGSAGNVTINAPSSGISLQVNSAAAGTAYAFSDGTVTGWAADFGATRHNFGTSSAHSSNWYAGNSQRVSLSAAGNVVISAPSSGTALTAQNGTARAIDATGSVAFTMSSVVHTFAVDGSGAYQDIGGANAWRIYTNSVERFVVGSTGAVIIRAPTSGVGLTIAGGGLTVTGTITGALTGDVTGNASTATTLQTSRNINGVAFNGSANITVTAAAETLTGTTLAALSGANLTALNATQLTSGTVPSARITAVDAAATINSIAIGYRTVPQNAQTGNYTAVIGDSGYHIYHASGAGAGDTYTIPANASVAYPVGTVLTFVNNDSNAVSIAITTDTMTLAGTTTTGTRTLAQNGIATAIKTTSTTWLISGTGLS